MIKFTIYHKAYFFKDKWVFSTSRKDLDYDELLKLYFKYGKRLKYSINDAYLLKHLRIENIPKPATFPKFSNEKPFKFNWADKVLIEPKIIGIRWALEGWEYQLENIGHKTSYQPENSLIKIKKIN
jgi:hypothetical protein